MLLFLGGKSINMTVMTDPKKKSLCVMYNNKNVECLTHYIITFLLRSVVGVGVVSPSMCDDIENACKIVKQSKIITCCRPQLEMR